MDGSGSLFRPLNPHPIKRSVNKEEQKKKETKKNPGARICVKFPPVSAVNCTANSTASNPNKVVNLITGFKATDEVSLNGSPTESPTTVGSCSGVPFCFISTSPIFFALSQAPPAFAIKIA